ncbi:hypothetical protein IAE57_04910 [Stenotrophomonas sp. S48]|uniref:hypothetical protein n=1 Tax=unclassified Stenotrophomonas TaxID=196198 RepID=UPI0019026962|nr:MULTISPECIES: hypothetical protein [unclassified Stenotrophomonas]MBK0025488.1 hypothetical protein [Stenotrophomonas sp. S48]MBK0047533.1 hypothetical protein [Stenotrophomonas sp. S49]
MAVARRELQGALLAGMMLAATAHAQQVDPVIDPPAASGVPAADAADAAAPPQGDVTTLGEVRAIKPEDEALDLYRFKNPVKFGDNRFSRDWSEPPSPEQVSMGGGYIMMGVVKGVLAAGRGLNKLTGGPDQIQAAIARPPPELTPEQRRRAQQFCEQQDGCDPSAGK